LLVSRAIAYTVCTVVFWFLWQFDPWLLLKVQNLFGHSWHNTQFLCKNCHNCHKFMYVFT
jgi:hypothetical protein